MSRPRRGGLLVADDAVVGTAGSVGDVPEMIGNPGDGRRAGARGGGGGRIVALFIGRAGQVDRTGRRVVGVHEESPRLSFRVLGTLRFTADANASSTQWKGSMIIIAYPTFLSSTLYFLLIIVFL